VISLIFRSSRRKPGPSPLGESWNGRDAPNLIRNHRHLAGQNWVPAFAGMSGLFGWLFILTAILLFLAAAPVAAQEPPPAPDRPLPDAVQEARAQALFTDIRCVVCQHEAIADSPAGIAADMRGLVREQIAAGRSDEQVRTDLVRRYGDFVLFTPPLRAGTWLLWFGPVAALLAAGSGLWFASRRRATATEPLSLAEEADLARILADQAVRPDPDAKSSDD
jgi:cytochrome c-type biogenesis protein CcmH